jgi:hypothetical protein
MKCAGKTGLTIADQNWDAGSSAPPVQASAHRSVGYPTQFYLFS